MRAERRPVAAVGAAAVLDAGALLLVAAQPSAWGFVPAGLMHVAAALAMLRWRGVEPSRRVLAAALCFALPLIGVAIAALTARQRGRGGDDLLARQEPIQRAESGAELARRLTASGPVWNALLAAEVETRFAVVTYLQRDPDARSITLLRRLLAHPDPDRALEAALALEEISAQYAERSEMATGEVERRPSRDTALAAAEVIASAIHNGLADLALLPAIGAQARDFYRKAAELDEQRAQELAWSRARLELAMLDPEAALALLQPVLETDAADQRLRELHRDAAYAARRFDLLPPLEPLPPPSQPLPAEPSRASAGMLREPALEPEDYYEELELRHDAEENEPRPPPEHEAPPTAKAHDDRRKLAAPRRRKQRARSTTDRALAAHERSFPPPPVVHLRRPPHRPPSRPRGA